MYLRQYFEKLKDRDLPVCKFLFNETDINQIDYTFRSDLLTKLDISDLVWLKEEVNFDFSKLTIGIGDLITNCKHFDIYKKLFQYGAKLYEFDIYCVSKYFSKNSFFTKKEENFGIVCEILKYLYETSENKTEMLSKMLNDISKVCNYDGYNYQYLYNDGYFDYYLYLYENIKEVKNYKFKYLNLLYFISSIDEYNNFIKSENNDKLDIDFRIINLETYCRLVNIFGFDKVVDENNNTYLHVRNFEIPTYYYFYELGFNFEHKNNFGDSIDELFYIKKELLILYGVNLFIDDNFNRLKYSLLSKLRKILKFIF